LEALGWLASSCSLQKTYNVRKRYRKSTEEAGFLAMQRIVGSDERALRKLTKRQE
jgi:hypothetical protein